jgi:hypothetical protein
MEGIAGLLCFGAVTFGLAGLVGLFAWRKNRSFWKSVLAVISPTLAVFCCVVIFFILAAYGPRSITRLSRVCAVAASMMFMVSAWLCPILFFMILAFKRFRCSKCKNELTSEEWKTRRCSRCGQFAKVPSSWRRLDEIPSC